MSSEKKSEVHYAGMLQAYNATEQELSESIDLNSFYPCIFESFE